MTAEMRLAADDITVHVLSPALLGLDDAGTFGVKSVDARNRVEFHAVEVVDSTDAGISVSGLPNEILLITIGGGFVKPGELVEPVTAPPRAGITDTSGEAPDTIASLDGTAAHVE
jgi:multidrug efflux system membrane fusion protein